MLDIILVVRVAGFMVTTKLVAVVTGFDPGGNDWPFMVEFMDLSIGHTVMMRYI